MVLLIGIILFNTELNMSILKLDEMFFFFLNYSLQLKQNIYSIGIFRALVVTKSRKKYKEKLQQNPIFESLQFLC